MTEIIYGKSRFKAAEAWHELSQKQYIALIPFSRILASEVSEEIEKWACQAWLGVSVKKWKKWVLTRWQWANIRRKFRWIFNTKPEGQPFTSFVFAKQTYLLPADGFANSTAIEVAFGNMAYIEFANPDEANPEALLKLVATFCRPQRTDLPEFRHSADWNGDSREAFTEQRTAERANDLAELPIGYKIAVLDYFERMNAGFLEQYGELFGTDNQPRYGDGRGWIMLLKNVAKEGHFGNFEQVCHTPVHLFFASLLDDVLDNRQRQDEAQKQQNK